MAELIDIGYLASPEAIGAAVTTTTAKAAVATTKAAEAAASAAAAQAVGATNDTVIAGRINDPASATATALTATITAALDGFGGETPDSVFTTVFTPPATADTPTIAVSTTSTFTGGVTTRPAALSGQPTVVDMDGDTHFRFDGTPSMSLSSSFAQVPYVPASPTVAGTFGSFVPRAHFLTPYTDKVEISFKPPQSTGNRYRLWVDGQPLTVDSQALGTLTTAAEHFMLLTFPSAKVREITWENPTRNLFGGVRLASGTPKRPARPSGVRLAIIGDSFLDGAGGPPTGATRVETFGALLASMVGAAEWALFGIGGTGYLATDPSHGPVAGKGPYSGRVASVVGYAPDVVIVFGSINDLGPSGTSYSTELQAAVQGVLDGLSTIPRVIVIGPPMPPYDKANNGQIIDYKLVNEAVRAGTLFAGREFIDPLEEAATNPWITAADLGTDKVHPTFAGHIKIAKRAFGKIGRLIRATAASATTPGTATTTTVAANPTSATVGDTVAFTATVLPSGATGSVQFKDGATTLGTSTVTAGTATLNAALASAGTRTITATFLPETLDYKTSAGVTSVSVLTAYSLGVNDYGHRYLAAKVTGSVGDIVTTWPDETGANPLVRKATDDTQFTIGDETGERKIVATGDGTGGNLWDATSTPEPFTVIAVVRVPTTNKIVVRQDGYAFSRASNGAFALTGTGSVTTTGNANFNVVAYVGAGPSSKLRVGATTVGPGTITDRAAVSTSNPNGFDLPASSLVASGIIAEYAEIIRYARELSSGELDTVFAAIGAHYTLV